MKERPGAPDVSGIHINKKTWAGSSIKQTWLNIESEEETIIAFVNGEENRPVRFAMSDGQLVALCDGREFPYIGFAKEFFQDGRKFLTSSPLRKKDKPKSGRAPHERQQREGTRNVKISRNSCKGLRHPGGSTVKAPAQLPEATSMHDKMKQLISDNKKLKDENRQLRQENIKLKGKLHRREKERGSLINTIKIKEGDIERLQLKNEQLSEDLAHAGSFIQKLEAEISSLMSQQAEHNSPTVVPPDLGTEPRKNDSHSGTNPVYKQHQQAKYPKKVSVEKAGTKTKQGPNEVKYEFSKKHRSLEHTQYALQEKLSQLLAKSNYDEQDRGRLIAIIRQLSKKDKIWATSGDSNKLPVEIGIVRQLDKSKLNNLSPEDSLKLDPERLGLAVTAHIRFKIFRSPYDNRSNKPEVLSAFKYLYETLTRQTFEDCKDSELCQELIKFLEFRKDIQRLVFLISGHTKVLFNIANFSSASTKVQVLSLNIRRNGKAKVIGWEVEDHLTI